MLCTRTMLGWYARGVQQGRAKTDLSQVLASVPDTDLAVGDPAATPPVIERTPERALVQVY